MPLRMPENFTKEDRLFVHNILFNRDYEQIKKPNLLDKIIFRLREIFNLHSDQTPYAVMRLVNYYSKSQAGNVILNFLTVNPNWCKRNHEIALKIFHDFSPKQFEEALDTIDKSVDGKDNLPKAPLEAIIQSLSQKIYYGPSDTSSQFILVNHPEVFKILVFRHLSEFTDANKAEILGSATLAKNVDNVRFLLNLGFYSKTADASGKTPLMRAFENQGYNREEIINILLEKTANEDLEIEDKDGYNILHYVDLKTALQFVENNPNLLKSEKSFFHFLQKLASSQEADYSNLINELINNTSFDISQGQIYALMKVAIASGNTQQVQKLILNPKLKLEGSSLQNNSLILEALEFPEILKLLLDLPNVNINYQDEKGYTPLMHAVKLGFTEAFRILLSKGAEAHYVGKDTKNAAQLAIELKRTDIQTIMDSPEYENLFKLFQVKTFLLNRHSNAKSVHVSCGSGRGRDTRNSFQKFVAKVAH